MPASARLGLDGEHEGLGVVQDAADRDGDGRSLGEHRRDDLDHLLELVVGELIGWPGEQRGHVQSFQWCHVQPGELG